jgi:hypothetical protein
VVWTVPWPLGSAWVNPGRPRPSSLYTFRRQRRRLGSALSGHPCASEFTEFAVIRLFDGRNEGLPRWKCLFATIAYPIIKSECPSPVNA